MTTDGPWGLTPLLERVRAGALAAARRPPLTDNVDPERFPEGMPVLTPEQSIARREHLAEHADQWQWLQDHLEPECRPLLLERLAFHVLGHMGARIGPSPHEVRSLLAAAEEQLVSARDVTPLRYAGSPASHRFDLRPLGVPATIESYMLGIQGTFQLQQYRSPTHPAAWPTPGDVAIDAGGCFGETALWLAHIVGPTGRVVTLEFAAENLVILRANLDRNPALAGRIDLVERALWDRTGDSLQIARGGPATTVCASDAPAAGSRPVRSVCLDDLVADAVVDRVDFVKMDIEGAEPAALSGAVRTLERFRPRLALAVYHDIDHLWQLPRFLAGRGLGYRFALGHFTMHDEETVLYAWTG
jgi:FkbM family methyltransferase